MNKKFWQKVHLSEVLSRLMVETSTNASELSRGTDLAITTIKRLCSNDANPTIKSLEPIAKYFDISINQLLGAEPLPQDKKRGTGIPDPSSWAFVPIISLNETINWPANVEGVRGREPLEYIAVDLEFTEELFAIRLEGNAMMPRFSEGTVLVFDPQIKPYDGCISLILRQGKMVPQYKEILFDGPEMYIRSVNPALPGSTMELFHDEQFRLLGVLRHARKDF